MAILPIVTYDDDILHKKASPVEKLTPEISQLVEDMFETMYNADGVGLAAPQIGELQRIFVVDADVIADDAEEPQYGPLAFINPEIISKSGDDIEMDEGCLSIPGVNAAVTRPDHITIKYLDEDFKEQQLEVGGWLSRVIQHEYDHLEGTLFLDYLSGFKQKLLYGKLKDISTGKMETEYPLVPKKPAPTT